MTDDRQRRRVLDQFVKEARASLQAVEQALAVGPARVGEADNLKLLFRAFHSIKGITGYADAREIGELSHEAEGLLREIQAGRLVLDDPTLGLLLTVHDQLIDLLDATTSGASAPPEWQTSLSRLRALTGAAKIENEVWTCPARQEPRYRENQDDAQKEDPS